MITTRYTELLGCSAPIQLSGMGGVATLELSAAVARAGGVGTISPARLGRPGRAIERLAAMGDVAPGVLALNVLVPIAEHLEMIDAVGSSVRIVDVFWGEPDDVLVGRIHDAGALASWQVGSLDEALRAEASGCDVIVVQGNEAGGHVWATAPLFETLDAVLDAVTVPVVAAGGIGSARQVAAALAMGADAVRVGTRFAAAAESGAHPDYVKALVEADGTESTPTGRFSQDCPLCPSTHRVLGRCVTAADALEGAAAGALLHGGGGTSPVPAFSWIPPTDRVEGNIGAMALYAGRGVGHCRHGQDAAGIVAELIGGAAVHLAAAAAGTARDAPRTGGAALR